MMNFLSKKSTYVFFTVFIIVGIVIFKMSNFSNHKSDNGGLVVKQDLVQRVTIAGSVIPLKKTVIIAPYNGYIKKLFVKVGDQVKVGDPLVSIVQSLQNGEDSFPIRSPLNGVVVQLERSEGQFVKEGDPKEFILRIDDNSKYFILANAPEIDRVKLKTGQEVIVKVSAIVDRTYKGIIRELSLAATEKDNWRDSNSVDFAIRIEVTDSDEKLRSGMSAIIDVIASKKENVLTLRHEFIRRDEEKYFVILANGERRDIQVGIQNEEGFEIFSGLSEGEKIKQIDFTELSDTE